MAQKKKKTTTALNGTMYMVYWDKVVQIEKGITNAILLPIVFKL